MEGKMLMPFKDLSESFVHGFECGQIWEKMVGNQSFDAYLFHVKNRKQVEMICQRFQYEFKIEQLNEEWCTLSGKPNNIIKN